MYTKTCETVWDQVNIWAKSRLETTYWFLFMLIPEKCVAWILLRLYKVQTKCVLTKNSPSPDSPGHTLLAVRAPTGTQLDVPIPKAVSPASLEPAVVYCFWFSFILVRCFSMIVCLLSGPELPGKVPGLPEKHQWANRCRASEQMLCQLFSCRTASPTAWRHFTERQISHVHFRRNRKQYPSVSGFG